MSDLSIPGQHGLNIPTHGAPATPSVPHGSRVPLLGALSIGATSYTTAMAPGAVVGAIIGRTPGSTLQGSGLGFTSNKLAIVGNNLVAGSAAPLLAADTTGVYSITETFVGSVNSPLVSGPFGSITVV